MKFHKQIIVLLLFIMPNMWAAAAAFAATTAEFVRYRSAGSRARSEDNRPRPAAPHDTDSKELIERRLIPPNKALMPKLLPSFGNLPQPIKSLIIAYNPDNMTRLKLPKPLQLSQANAQRTFNHGAFIGALAWHPSQHHVATGGEDGKVIVWDCSKKKKFKRKLTEFDHKKDLYPISSIAWHPSGKRIIIGSSPPKKLETVTLWDTEKRVQVAKETSNNFLMHPSGNLFLFERFFGGIHSTYSVWHVSDWTAPSFSFKRDICPGRNICYQRYLDGCHAAAWHPSEKLIVCRQPDPVITLPPAITPLLVWDTDRRYLRAELRTDEDENVRSVIWHPSGRSIITGGNKGIKVWDAQNGTRLARFNPAMDIQRMTCHPRGTHIGIVTDTWKRHQDTPILAATDNKDDYTMLKILDTDTYTVQAELAGATTPQNVDYVTDCAYSHDGNFMAAICNNYNINVWNVALLSQLDMNEDQMALLWALGDAKDKGKESQSLKDIETAHGFDHERLKATIAQFGPEALKHIINYFNITDIRSYVDWRRFLSLKFD